MRKAHLIVTLFCIDITFTFCLSSKGNLMTAQCAGCNNTTKTIYSKETATLTIQTPIQMSE